MHRRFWIAVLGCALVAATGCKGKGPSPSKSPAADTGDGAKTSGAASAPTNPHETGEIPLQSPHGDRSPTDSPPPGGAVDLGAITVMPPASWRFENPTSSMRRAQFKVPGKAGEAELIVFFFGAAGAGTNQANTDRWIGQFKNDDGSPVTNAKPTETKIAGFDVTRVDVAGSFAGGMGATSPEQVPGQRLLGAIIQTPGGPYYFKLLGPDTTVSENRDAFDRLLQSTVVSP